MAYRMEGRVSGFEKGTETFWSGDVGYFGLDQNGILEMTETLCLWHFLFENTRTQQLIKYLGFLDLDMPLYDFKTMRGDQIRQVFQREVEPHLNGFQWFAYFSGSKGFHVYLLDDRFFFKVDAKDKQSPGAMKAALSALLPEELYKRIDTSIYAMNKGIRPWTQKNPKVSVMRVVRLACADCPVQDVYDFFEWIADTLNNPCVNSLSEQEVSVTGVPRTPEFARADALRVNHASGPANVQTLMRWISDRLGHDNLPGEPTLRDGNLYFADEDAWCFVDAKELTKHKRCKCWWRIFDGKAEQWCLADRHKERKFILSFDSISGGPVKKSVVDFEADYLPGQVITVDVNERFLPQQLIEENLMPKGSRLIVCAPMGTGKTFSLNQMIKKNRNELKRILVLGTRQSQCCVFHGAFEGSANYLEPQEGGKQLYEVDYLVLCLNSLMRVAKYDPDVKGFVVPHYDLLVIDEVMSFLEALVSPLLATANAYQPAIFEMFKLLLKASDRVVLMDGLPGPQIFRFLSDPKVSLWHQFRIIKHVRESECKKFVFQPDPFVLAKLVDDCMRDGRSTVVVSDSKKILKMLERNLPDQVLPFVMTICGDASPHVKKSASDPRANWKHLRYLGYNTALGPGASFDAMTKEEGAFDEIIVFVTCKVSGPTEIYQLISRIRHPLNKRVHICVLESKTKFSILEEAMGRSTSEQLSWMTHRLMSEAVKFDRLAQSLPLTIKKQAGHLLDWTDLCLEKSPPELIRQLASEQKLRLVYEPNDFFSLLAWARLESEKAKNSSFFVKELQCLIQLGGGELEICRFTKDTVKSQKAFIKNAADAGKTRESRQFPAAKLEGRLSPCLVKKMTDMIEVANFQVQSRFFSLVRHFSASNESEVMERFSRQIERFFAPSAVPQDAPEKPAILRISNLPRVPISLTATLPEICLPFQELVSLLGLQFNPESGHLEGEWNTQTIDSNSDALIKVYKKLEEVRLKTESRACPVYKFDSEKRSSLFRSINAAIAAVFKWAGFSVFTFRKDGQRRLSHFALDKKTSQLRYAMAGYNCDTMEKDMLSEDALIYFAEKYL